MPAHEIQDDLPRMPFADRGEDIKRRGRHEAPHAVEGKTPRLVIAACGGQDREHDERYDQVVDQLQRQLRSPRRPVVERAVIELLAVVTAHLGQHRMGLFGARRHQVRHDAVAGRDAQPAHAPRGDIDAVAVVVDQVAVPVGMHRKHAFVSPLHDTFFGGAGLVVAVHVHEHQQHIGEVDHQTDRHGDQQVQDQIGVFGLQFHIRQLLAKKSPDFAPDGRSRRPWRRLQI